MSKAFNRRAFISLLTLPIGCTIQFIEPISSLKTNRIEPVGGVRDSAVGQSWVYRKYNCYNSQLLDVVTEQVAKVGKDIQIVRNSKESAILGDEIHSEWGRVKRDSYWEMVQTYEKFVPHWLNGMKVGEKEDFETYYFSDTSSFKYWLSGRIYFVGWEKVKLPAGTFDTMHFEKIIRLPQYDSFRLDTVRRDSIWLSPEVGRWVVRETNGEYRVSGGKGGSIRREDYFRWQLESWT
jgi:hypothetical protein